MAATAAPRKRIALSGQNSIVSTYAAIILSQVPSPNLTDTRYVGSLTNSSMMLLSGAGKAPDCLHLVERLFHLLSRDVGRRGVSYADIISQSLRNRVTQ